MAAVSSAVGGAPGSPFFSSLHAGRPPARVRERTSAQRIAMFMSALPPSPGGDREEHGDTYCDPLRSVGEPGPREVDERAPEQAHEEAIAARRRHREQTAPW